VPIGEKNKGRSKELFVGTSHRGIKIKGGNCTFEKKGKPFSQGGRRKTRACIKQERKKSRKKRVEGEKKDLPKSARDPTTKIPQGQERDGVMDGPVVGGSPLFEIPKT